MRIQAASARDKRTLKKERKRETVVLELLLTGDESQETISCRGTLESSIPKSH